MDSILLTVPAREREDTEIEEMRARRRRRQLRRA